MKKYNYTNEICKSNRLIESCYNLTTSQNRILYLAMTKLETRILEKNINIQTVEDMIYSGQFDLIEIPISLYRNTFSIKSNNIYTEMEKIINELYESEIIYLNNHNDVVRKRWVITCRYDRNNKGIALQFHPDLIRDLLIFKSEYTKMIFDDFANKINKKHSFRMYELCKQYLNYGYRDFFVDDYRFKLALDDGEYPRFVDFKKRVIMPSIEEINKYTDIEIEYEELLKINKAVNKFRLKIKKKPNYSLESLPSNKPCKNQESETIIKLISRILGVEVTAGEAKQILKTSLTAIDSIPELKDENIGVVDYISNQLEVVKKYIQNSKDKELNFIGVLISALKDNWKTNIIDIQPKQKELKFNNFESRDYNFDALEQMALGYIDYDEDRLYK